MQNSLALLLDTIADAANLWSAEGELLYRNRASGELDSVLGEPRCGYEPGAAVEALQLGGRSYERRYLRCHIERSDYVLEIIRDLGQS